MPKGSGIWDAARKLLNRVDTLEQDFRTKKGAYYETKNKQRAMALMADIERLTHTQYLASFEFDDLVAASQVESNEFDKMRVVLKGIQDAARKASKTLIDAN